MFNHDDDLKGTKNSILFCVAVASAVLLLFLIVLYTHEGMKTSKHVEAENTVENESPEVEYGKSNLESKDLDFWDLYDEKKQPDDEEPDEEDTKKTNMRSSSEKDRSSSDSSSEKRDTSSSSGRGQKDDDNKDDGKHVRVTGEDGKPIWYEISDKIKKNNYNFEDYLGQENGLLKYRGSDVKSLTGIDISSQNGAIDFAKVKDAGVDFVMIKVAGRGYDTGLVAIDDRFVEYTQGATAASLQMGMYFYTNAITDVEAVEEANYAIAAGMNYNFRYPVAIVIQNENTANLRTKRLTSSERTAIVKKFCETVKSYGKIPVICATRDVLITGLDLEDLSEYDIWLKEEATTADSIKSDAESDETTVDNNKNNKNNSSNSSSNTDKKNSNSNNSEESNEGLKQVIGTDYPYDFALWQYSQNGSISGVQGSVNLNMSFVNYAER